MDDALRRRDWAFEPIRRQYHHGANDRVRGGPHNLSRVAMIIRPILVGKPSPLAILSIGSNINLTKENDPGTVYGGFGVIEATDQDIGTPNRVYAWGLFAQTFQDPILVIPST